MAKKQPPELPAHGINVPKGQGGSEYNGERDRLGIPKWKEPSQLSASEQARLIRSGHDPNKPRK